VWLEQNIRGEDQLYLCVENLENCIENGNFFAVTLARQSLRESHPVFNIRLLISDFDVILRFQDLGSKNVSF
jgi:hypothetical protein